MSKFLLLFIKVLYLYYLRYSLAFLRDSNIGKKTPQKGVKKGHFDLKKCTFSAMNPRLLLICLLIDVIINSTSLELELVLPLVVKI